MGTLIATARVSHFSRDSVRDLNAKIILLSSRSPSGCFGKDYELFFYKCE